MKRYLADPEQDRYGRIQAAHALQEVAAAHPAERDRVVDILREQLRLHQSDRGLNGFLVNYLLDLRAREALDDIKAAYLADKVDRKVVGNYSDVLAEFGLPPDPEVPSRPIHEDSPLKAIFDRMLGDVLAPKSELPKSRQRGESRDKQKRTRRTRKRRRRRRKRKSRVFPKRSCDEMTDKLRRVITASEVGQYTYCARAWWLAEIQGLESINVREMAHGEQAHEAHGGLIAGYHRTRRLAYVLLLLAALIGAVLLAQLGIL